VCERESEEFFFFNETKTITQNLKTKHTQSSDFP
jgi:hypothetical protein